MINAMLLRVHQSGHLAKLDDERKSLVKEALAVYKDIRKDIKEAVPFWPIGLSDFSDEWVVMGLKTKECAYIAVWRREGGNKYLEIPVTEYKGREMKVSCIYPSYNDSRFEWHKESGKLVVEFEQEKMARLFKLW